MAWPVSSVFSLIPSDTKFLRRQLNAANLRIVRYTASGQPIYGYTDSNNVVHELGTVGSFNPLNSSLYINATAPRNASDPLGLRTISGVYNNLKPGRENWGATNEAFLRLTNSNYSNYVGQNVNNAAFNPGRYGPGSPGFQDSFQTVANGQTIDKGVSLIRNGGFEENSVNVGDWAQVTSLAGWYTTAASGRMEVQELTQMFGAAAQGTAWIELDNEVSNIRQDVQTKANQTYELSFAYAARPGVAIANTKVEVYWNGQLLDTLNENGIGQSQSQWKTYTYQVQGSSNATTGLEFRSVGNTLGGGVYIDNVQLFNNADRVANSSNLYADPFKTVVDYTPRMISQTISSQSALDRLGIATDKPSSSNLLRNGSFEDKQYSGQAAWFETSLNGWTTTASSGIEVQNLVGLYGGANQGNNWIELDSQVSNIRQDVQTETGKSYQLSFAYSARPGVTLPNTKVEVYWNGQLIDTLNADGTGLFQNQWKNYTYQVQGTGNAMGLEFRSVGNAMTLGGFIDNVKLVDPNNNSEIDFIRSTRSSDQNGQSQSGGSGIFTLFGQYFDHGLDFIEKGGNINANGQSAKLVIPLSPSDPMYNAAKGVTSITVSRANVANPLSAGADGKFRTADDINPGSDGKYGTADDSYGPMNPSYINRTSAYSDLSQAYGSDEQITQLLREWVLDPNQSGKFIAGDNLLTGYSLEDAWQFTQADGTSEMTWATVPTLKELRSHLIATGRDDLTWEDIQNYRARDSQGRVLDADPNTAGVQTIRTGQAIILDANPHFDASRIYQNGRTVDVIGALTGVELGTTLDARGLPTTITVGGTAYSLSKYINFNSFSIQPNLSTTDKNIANELLLRSVSDHYIAGDGRLNENFGLTTMHHVFHENHTYQLNNIKATVLSQQSQDPTKSIAHSWQVEVNSRNGDALAAGVSVVNGHYEDAQGNYVTANGRVSWNQDKLFEAARLINQTEYQHITVEYARFVSPDIPKFSNYNSDVNAGVSLEYAQAAFRFGHSQLRETIDLLDPNGSLTGNVQKFALKAAFLNPAEYAANGPASVAQGMARQVSGEIDEFITPALQQSLLGQPLDLAAINIARGRDLGLPTLNDTRKQLRDSLAAEKASGSLLHTTLKVDSLNPYTSWNDFGNNMIHPASLVDFIAAYSFDGDLAKAGAILGLSKGTIAQGSAAALGLTLDQANSFLNGGDQGFQKIDLWMGGLAEKHVTGGQLGSTFNVIFVDQMERSQDGDRFYYLHRIDSEFQEAYGILSQIEAGNFKDMVERTTGARHLQGDVFEYSDNHIELGEKAVSNAGTEHKYGNLAAFIQQGLGVRSIDGASTSSNGSVVTFNGVQYILDARPSESNSSGSTTKGFNAAEVIGGTNNNDYIDGGNGSNTIYGEGGNDILIAGNSADFLYGGIGNDNLNGGNGDDLVNGGQGNDVLYGGAGSDVLVGEVGNDTLYGEAGDDDIIAGAGDDVIYTDLGNDRVFGGEGNDTLVYGSSAYQNPTTTPTTTITYGRWDWFRVFPIYTTTYTTTPSPNYGYDSNNYQFSMSTLQGAWKITNTQSGEGTDTFDDIEQINYSTTTLFKVLNGGDGNDTLTATSTASVLSGGAGNDLLTGGTANDHLTGGEDNDTLNGGAGIDTAYYLGILGDYQVAMDTSSNVVIRDMVTTNGNEGSDTLIAVEKIKFGSTSEFEIFKGDAGNNSLAASSGKAAMLVGGLGSDTLNGNTGNDVLIGGNGITEVGTIDILAGGGGNDLFILGQAGRAFYDDGLDNGTTYGNADYARITDFTAGDRIQLVGSAANYTLVANTTVGGQTGIGLYLNNNGGATGAGVYGTLAAGMIGGNDDLIGLIQGSAATNALNLTNTSTFSFV